MEINIEAENTALRLVKSDKNKCPLQRHATKMHFFENGGQGN